MCPINTQAPVNVQDADHTSEKSPEPASVFCCKSTSTPSFIISCQVSAVRKKGKAAGEIPD